MALGSKSGHPLGLHRVVGGLVLPQAASRLDPGLPIRASEMLLAVSALQIDSASFAQLKKSCPDKQALANAVKAIVAERGKMQNPVTGSGGMLLGSVAEIGTEFPAAGVGVGDEVATLVSLTATPLAIQEIQDIDFAKERVKVTGHAILFSNSLFAKMPRDIPPGAMLAAFDICGAPALAVKRARLKDTIFVIGLGKAGRSVVAALNVKMGDRVRVLGTDASSEAVAFCQKSFQGRFERLDACDPLKVLKWIEKETHGGLADFVISAANIPDTEMAAILATKPGGRCLFFGMATDFQKAALGAESVGRDCELLIGCGYTKGHAEFMANLLRSDANLLAYFVKCFS